MTRIIRCDAVVPEPTTAAALVTWTYRDQKADAVTGKALVLPGAIPHHRSRPPARSRDGCASLARYGALGAVIPGTGHAQRPVLHRDAETVHDAVVALSAADPLGALLLVRHGKSGEPPDHHRGLVPVPEPVPESP